MGNNTRTVLQKDPNARNRDATWWYIRYLVTREYKLRSAGGWLQPAGTPVAGTQLAGVRCRRQDT